MRSLGTLIICTWGILATACLPIGVSPAAPPSATAAPLSEASPTPPAATPTPTIVWFPPTPTYTPMPTIGVTPTADLRPGIGAAIFTDDFTDPQAWTLDVTTAGSVALGDHELTIAIAQADTYLFSVRMQPVWEDFYLEITASPTLCRGLDEYGLLLRVSPDMEYYRFSLSCDGQARLDRIYRGQASSPQTWTLSGGVPPGAPSSSRLAVWAVGAEMRFFVNDRYQFTVNDPLMPAGGLGVFARSSGDLAVTVNFSDLVIYQVED